MPSLGVRKGIKVAISYGQNGFAFGVTAGGNYGKGYGNGDEQRFRGSRIGDKQSYTTIHSQADTNIKGSQVSGEKASLKAQNLNIESLQDTMTYKGKQQQVQGQVTVGYGVSASASYNRSKVNADYASVTTQTGIFAGDEGYDVAVEKNTDLKGAVITSTEQAETDGKNRLSTDTLSYSHIENRASHSTSGIGVSGSVAMNFDTPLGDKGIAQSNKQAVNDNGQKLYVNAQGEQTTSAVGQDGKQNSPVLAQGLSSLTGDKAVGFGRDSDSQSSITKSGINTANINIRDDAKQLTKTGKTTEQTIREIQTDTSTESAVENSGKLEKTFDKNKVKAEIDLQVEVTQTFDKNRQEIKERLYKIVDHKRELATNIRRQNGGYDTEESKRLDDEASNLDEKTRWIDIGLGAALGFGDESTFWKTYLGTQADRAYRSATKPKEMWFQKCDSANGECNRDISSRQIWSLNDLTTEERKALRENHNLITISNPGIFNDREDALKNAQKQNISSTNQRGIIVAMNSPTGDYKGWGGGKLLTSLTSELMYAAYDKINDKVLSGLLPLSNAQKLNQDLYLQAMEQGFQIDTSNHSRGGLTASIALKEMNIWQGINNIPIRKSRFYGTATNVSDYAEQLKKNGYRYIDQNGKMYLSGAYSAVHKADAVGNKWNLGIMGFNDATGGACLLCYSHSSYYAEVPDLLLHKSLYKEFKRIWGQSRNNEDNPSLPILVTPFNNKEIYNDKAF